MILDLETITQEDFDSIIMELTEYKVQLVTLKVTVGALLKSPDDCPLSIAKRYLQPHYDEITKLGL